MTDLDLIRHRDLFLLDRAISRHLSPVVDALTFDAVVAELGAPGVGYDPLALCRAAVEAGRKPRADFDAVASHGPEHARAEGWI